ncbi:hypothetical protein HPB52_013852 [Rhipicephalus sanguineus]|uniref:Uncharacterized protein n=1 Tax=Rhipicephalus sanguineus TaxID=34632 RepID=A0A9D4PYY1_RHISA|nr:hypothetical protein HPB52_013852 [Rhipicephalus sanguineus]
MLMWSVVLHLYLRQRPSSHRPLPCLSDNGILRDDHQSAEPTCGARLTIDPFASTAKNQATFPATAVIEILGLAIFLVPLLFPLKTVAPTTLIACRPAK